MRWWLQVVTTMPFKKKRERDEPQMLVVILHIHYIMVCIMVWKWTVAYDLRCIRLETLTYLCKRYPLDFFAIIHLPSGLNNIAQFEVMGIV